ncbi:MFS transporter [Pseudonocardia sp. CA-142604]|uniref:MFS transporter n=1 Tax=Pseudonocardia sp. CA-142604 TaxID=3240024 RepID=UPI003D933EFB
MATIGAGNAFEWYDWNVYATFSVFFASQFFTNTTPGSALLATLAVFAVGFIARPFGGLLFGWLADHTGRQPAMTLTVAVAAAGSLIIGLTPTAATIGIAAPIVLLLARLIQGLAQGGELPSAQTYLAEIAPPTRRGLWSSLIYFSGSLGTLAGTILAAVLAGHLTHTDMIAYGWRIPFLLGGLIGLFAVVMRKRMAETPVFAHATTGPRTPIRRQFFAHPTLLLRVIGLTAGGTAAFYLWAVAAAPFAIQQRGTDPSGALWAATAATVLYILVLPLWGALSDRIGRRAIFVISVVPLGVLLFPLEGLIQGQAWQLLVAMGVSLLLGAGASAIAPALFAEMFPTGIRAVGFGVPYSLAIALFGGTAPYLQAYFDQRHETTAFYWWVIALIAVSLVTIVLSPETRGRDLNTVP